MARWPSSEINVTPMIDVLLVMLIIFMVIVPVRPRGLKSVLPSPAVPGVAEVADRAVLIPNRGGARADGGMVPGGRCRLLELVSRRSVRQVLVNGEAKLDFGVIAGVIDAGQAAGASVGLLTPGSEVPAK